MIRQTLWRSTAAAAALAAASLSQSAWADEAFTYSGFASFVVGKVVGGERQDRFYDYACPCFIADYGHGALYGPHWQVKQESKVGLQGTYTFTPSLSATAQVVGRGNDEIEVGLEWLYLSYDLSPSWTLQVGRKRLPIYYYSDFQDVGYAYTWVRPPTDLYGWEISNYNGVNLTYRGEWDGWSVKSNLLAGREDTKKNQMQRIFFETPQDVTWKRIVGGDLVLNRDWFTTRLTYIQSDVQQWDHETGERVTPDPSVNRKAEKQKIYGISTNIDIDNWFVRSEYSVFDRSSYAYKSKAFMIGVGARFGDFTAMATKTRYKDRNDHAPDEVQHDNGWSATLRYELTPSTAVKVQYDRFKDHSAYDFVGSSKVVSFSLDTVF